MEAENARTYQLVLTEPSSNPRARAIIQEYAGVDRIQAEELMQHPPSTILENRPLQEVVELRTRLMRFGVAARIEAFNSESAAVDAPPDSEDITPTAIDQGEPVIDSETQPEASFPLRPPAPASPPGLGLFSGSRVWTCLASIIIVGILLSVFTIWMLHSMRKSESVAQKSKTHITAPQGDTKLQAVASKPVETPENIADIINTEDGAKASLILNQYKNLNSVKAIAAVINAGERLSADRETTSHTAEQDQATEDTEIETIQDLNPATIAALSALKAKHHLENDPAVHWEITGTRITGRTNLPESTALTVQVRMTGQQTRDYYRQVNHGKIILPLFDEIPMGTALFDVRLAPYNEQPPAVQSIIRLLTKPIPQDLSIRVQLDMEQHVRSAHVKTTKEALRQVTGQMNSEGFDAVTNQPANSMYRDSLIVIRGSSEDPFLFVKSAVLASGMITRTINDPPEWILIVANNENYWIESYQCREAIRNFQEFDPALDDFILNNLITI